MHGSLWPSFICFALISSAACERHTAQGPEKTPATEPTPATATVIAVDPIASNAARMLAEGRQIFRDDTFGSEAFWGHALKLHEAIAGSRAGGVGPGLSPKSALAAGLKVDIERLPDSLVNALRAGKVDLDDVGNTIALLQADAVVGIKGVFANGRLTSVGITCALCHSTVDNSLAPGIGKRLDGWANRDLDVGAVIALAPELTPVKALLGVDDGTLHKVLASWGPGKFDAQMFLDRKGLRPDGGTAATLIPPAFGLAGVNMSTSTGWGIHGGREGQGRRIRGGRENQARRRGGEERRSRHQAQDRTLTAGAAGPPVSQSRCLRSFSARHTSQRSAILVTRDDP
jgi:cytochrome c5